MTSDFGMIGLGTMGRNFALNVKDKGFSVCGFDPDENQRNRFLSEGSSTSVSVAGSLTDLVAKVRPPGIFMLLVPAGKIVDSVINELLPVLTKGAILIDGGNSHYTDTERRYQALQAQGIHFIGMGVSGGEAGARFGPSMMPGGNPESYKMVKNILEAAAAKASDGAPCVAYMGNSAAGHYVKMVHNGIEYAMMQLISEVYALLKTRGYSNTQLQALFEQWDQNELQSYLIGITSQIFKQKDELSQNDLVDMILDKAKQKGTGLWTSQSALELNVPVPVIDTAVSMRYLSSLKEARTRFSKLYFYRKPNPQKPNELLEVSCKNALYFGFVLAYTQGMNLIKEASAAFGYDIDIKTVLQVWRAGCIIRSALLSDLYLAQDAEPELESILASKIFVPILQQKRESVTAVISTSMSNGVATPALAASLNYLDAFTSERLPANLIQAQRDYFGAHTFERLDKEGTFHTQWDPAKATKG